VEAENLVGRMRVKLEDPDPHIDFGEKGEEYSFEVFRFAAKALVVGPTCAEIARLTDVFMEEFFPKRAGSLRIPDRRQWEEWRIALLLQGGVRVLRLIQKMDLLHIASDATTKGKSKGSRKTSILQTSGKGLKDGVEYPVVFNLDVIKDGKAETEVQSMVEALKLDLGGGVVEEVDILKVASGTSDHASSADRCIQLFGEEKEAAGLRLTEAQKARLSDFEKKVAPSYKKRKCQTHLGNILEPATCRKIYTSTLTKTL